MSVNEVYLKLLGIRERACSLQSNDGLHEIHRYELAGIVGVCDRLGAFYAPQQWSKYDEPPLPEATS